MVTSALIIRPYIGGGDGMFGPGGVGWLAMKITQILRKQLEFIPKIDPKNCKPIHVGNLNLSLYDLSVAPWQ